MVKHFIQHKVVLGVILVVQLVLQLLELGREHPKNVSQNQSLKATL